MGEELSSDNNTIRDFLEEIQIPENNSKEKTYNQDPLALDISEIKMNFQKKMKDYEKLTIKNVDEPYDPEIK